MVFGIKGSASTARGLGRLLLVATLAPCLAAGAQSSPVVDSGWNSSTSTSLQAAGRILNQATFGPIANDVFNVEKIGVTAYVDQQLAMPAYQIPLISLQPIVNGDCGSMECTVTYAWWNDVLYGQDQLRQRVAFELSKLFVASVDSVDPRYMPTYLNLIANDAFGNWFTLMQDMALSPAMGTYLNMGNSFVPTANQRANENFARELMQLFSIGTVALNQDGSAQLDGSGNPIPNYTDTQVQNFALAYTGWTFANDDCSVPTREQDYWWPDPPGQRCRMVPLPGMHSTVAKTLMRGTVLPAGQSAQADLNGALQNIFQSPSLPPFVCRRLIQDLVRSNPSPAYISRVAGVFINDGTGVRGNLKAVIRAVLLDPEARAGDSLTNKDPNAGKMRDPVLWWASAMRAVGATSSAVLPNVGIFEGIVDLWLADMDEVAHAPTSVFSFYSPDFQQPGTNLFAPEFQNENAHTLVYMTEHLQDALNNNWNLTGNEAKEFTISLGPGSFWYNCATQWGPTNLVNALDALLMHGTMTQDMRDAIVAGIKDDDTATMVRSAFYLILTSPQYRVML